MSKKRGRRWYIRPSVALLNIPSIKQKHDVCFPDDATIDYAIREMVTVGYATEDDEFDQTNGTSPTINLVEGGDLGCLSFYNSSIANISGGTATIVSAHDSSLLNITGGTLSTIHAEGSSVVNINGGNISDMLTVVGNATLNLYGTNLAQTLVDPNYVNFCSVYKLSGVLADGTPFVNTELYIDNSCKASVNLINSAA